MNKSIIVINSTNRKNGNSEVLVNEFINGAKENNNVEVINLRELNFGFCIGCLACQNTGKCVLNDDISKVIDKVKNADILVFATPIYYYAMSGQLKTFLDRMNPLYIADYKFKEAYLFTACADEEDSAMNVAISEVKGWISCFDDVEFKEALCATVTTNVGDIKNRIQILNKAFEIGKNI